MSDIQDTEASHVVLVQCTAAKRHSAAPARDLYDESTYYRKQRGYAEAVADHWFVQSAEHGLLDPETVIEPYNTHAKDIDNPEEWAADIADALDCSVPADATVEVLGGAHYCDPLTPELEKRGFEVLEPLRGQKIGERMASLGRMTNTRLEAFA